MTNKLAYPNAYYTGTREDLVAQVAKVMSPKRLAHVLRVEEMALELARIHGGDLEQVSVAALVHDYGKERSDDAYLTLLDTGEFSEELRPYGNAIWHGVLGTVFIEGELGITDSAILQAVRHHTTGAADMTVLDQLIYVADYVERGRDFPVVAEARELAFKNLDKAVAFETEQTLRYLIEKKALIYPKTIETYNHWVVTN